MRSVGDEVRGQVIATVYDDGTYSVRLFTPDGTDDGFKAKSAERAQRQMLDNFNMLVRDEEQTND